MISRRDNLLNRPWEQRRYENHKKKIQAARPAIDNKPPKSREHVLLKLKKKQKEQDRCEQINQNNFSLLKRLSYVMRTNRVDNSWTKPQPNFLNRVTMFDVMVPNFEQLYLERYDYKDFEAPVTRKQKCLACNPRITEEEFPLPEERVPWEPEKISSNSRIRSKSVPPRKVKHEISVNVPKSAGASQANTKSKITPKSKAKSIVNIVPSQQEQILVKRGCLNLSVNFPSDATVKLQKRHQETVLFHGICNCKLLEGK